MLQIAVLYCKIKQYNSVKNSIYNRSILWFWKGNIELLLNYCDRFYDRQFITRAKVNHDIVQQFETLLLEYFAQESLIDVGLPDVKYFASRLNFFPNYLSDLLKRYTGKTTQKHIHLHPSHFTKIFKTKLGKSPKEFRLLN